MQRREFVAVAAAVAGQYQTRNAERGTRNRMLGRLFRVPSSDFRIGPAQEPSLSPEVFARRLDHARAELGARGLHGLIATPGTNYEYLTGHYPGRSERLSALILPLAGAAVVVCPSFETERIKRHGAIADARGWEEQDDPYALVRDSVRRLAPRAGTMALESSTGYQTALRLAAALSGWTFVDAAPVTERLRIVKAPEEVALIRRAIEITQGAMTATFAQLAAGMTERDVARLLSREMQQRGTEGGGLVQFGPSSALPHGGPAAAAALARETVVLIDCGCRVGGYESDITRTVWFGDSPTDEFRRVFNVVHDAQTAAIELGRPRTPCQDMDRAARRVITAAGYGPFFTHRLGHGLGMDGHEPPYLVESNALGLEPGMVFTDEPGIYQLGKFGGRIEDDCLMTENGVEGLSRRAAKL